MLYRNVVVNQTFPQNLLEALLLMLSNAAKVLIFLIFPRILTIFLGIGLFMLIRSSNMTYDGRYERRYESCSGVMITIRKEKICNSIFK